MHDIYRRMNGLNSIEKQSLITVFLVIITSPEVLSQRSGEACHVPVTGQGLMQLIINMSKKYIVIGFVSILFLLMTAIFISVPAQAATGDVISSSKNLVTFEIDRSNYGWWLSYSEAMQVCQQKIIPALKQERPYDYYSYFDSKPYWYTSGRSWTNLVIEDLRFHYNYLRWDNDIGYNNWYISQRYWN